MPDPTTRPGEGIGLPAAGPGSVARFGRRLAALAIDLACAVLIGFAFFHHVDPATGAVVADPLATNVVFGIVQVLFLPTIGGSPGHRALGLRLVEVNGGWVGLWRPVLRTALLMLLVPALFWDSDRRGLHDKIAGTVLVRGGQ